MIQKFRYIFSRADKFKLVGLVVLMIIGSVLELLAVAVFNPFIEVMMQTSSIADDSFLQFFFQHTNIDSIEGYLIALSFIIAVIYVVKNVYLTFEQNVILSFSYPPCAVFRKKFWKGRRWMGRRAGGCFRKLSCR